MRRAVCPRKTSDRQVTERLGQGCQSPNRQTTRADTMVRRPHHGFTEVTCPIYLRREELGFVSGDTSGRNTSLLLFNLQGLGSQRGLLKNQIEKGPSTPNQLAGRFWPLQIGATSIQKSEDCPHASSLTFFVWCTWALAFRCRTHAGATGWIRAQSRNALEAVPVHAPSAQQV